MLELPFCPVCLGRADTSLSFFVGTSEICRHGTRAKTTKIFSGCSGPKYWATKQIVIKWPKKAPPLPPRLWEFSQPGGWRSAQATHQHRARGRTLMAACLQWSQHHERTSRPQTMPMAGCQNTQEWGIRFPESSGLNHNLADRFRENKKFKAFLE